MAAAKTEKIICQCGSGLANRIQIIESSILLAQELDVPMSIIWPIKNHLNASFHSIFDTPPRTSIMEFSDWNALSKMRLDFAPDFELNQPFLDTHSFSDSSDILALISGFQRPILNSWRRLYPGKRRQQILKLNKGVQQEVDQKTHMALGAVGVHVRRTDNDYAIAHSTNEAFFRFLDSLPADQRIFLCTDDPVAEIEFLERYGSRITIHPKESLRRDIERGIIEAVIDLALLSKTDFILGSAGSTFSKCASFWGGIPLHIANKHD